MNLRLWSPVPLAAGVEFQLDPGAARHVQVRRLQPGDAVHLFDGQPGFWQSTVLRMTRHDVRVRVESFEPHATELPLAITLAVGVPANERMDWLVEKATELGAQHIQPLLCERAVLRVADERAQRKQTHWQAVAQAASEQSGRTRLPQVAAVQSLPTWLATQAEPADATHKPTQRLVLSTRPDAQAFAQVWQPGQATCLLSGPEGGLTEEEETAALRAGFTPASLGPRILRAETAPLAALAYMGLLGMH